MNPPKISPNNPDKTYGKRRHAVAAICTLALSIVGASSQGRAEGRTQYIVDGLALGDPVAPNSAVYREYRCRPSEQFSSFIWCRRHKTENGKFGEFTSVNSILHSLNWTTVYVSRFIEPAFFGPGDVDREIQRLSQRFDAGPRTLQPPRWWKGSQSIIAYWGDVTLEPLDAEGRARIAAGQSAQSGILFDFLGDFGRSEKENLPIFQLGGGEGYVWGARIDENGKGALRMTAIDATQFVPPTAVARLETGRSVGKDSPETAVPAPKPKILLSSGSGFFVSNDGHVLTNNHVIEDCNSIRVFMDTAAPVEARAIARDSSNDLALLATSLKPPAVAAPRSVLRLGEAVAAFGYPHADILATSGNFTQGSVTALVGLGDDSRYLQMSVPVQAGNSGGPLLDQNGNLVGIVASKLNAIKVLIDSGDLPQNVNFALKASVVENFLDSNRIKYVMGSATSALKSEDLADQARSMSVFILCK